MQDISRLFHGTARRKGDGHGPLRGVRRMAVAAMAAMVALTHTAAAQNIRLLRDSEIEVVIGDYSRPIFRAAGLGSQNIHIHLVNSRDFNAFVVDGQNMFINAGAIMRSETPNQLIGVIAHEAGHIAGGHLSRLRAHVSRAQSAALMVQLLGIAAIAAGAIAGGGSEVGDAGAAVLYGGQSAIQRSVLAYRRAEESAADQAAVSYLNRTKQSAQGMLETFRYFSDQSLASLQYVDPYVQSHPMPQDRIAQLRALAQSSPYFDRRDPPELQFRHDMIRAKLEAFLNKNNPQLIFRKYPPSDTSLPARYARAIARYFSGGIRSAIGDIDALVAEQPSNPYFHELKGQFLLESNEVARSIPPLRDAVTLAPNAGLIRIMLAQALLASNEQAHLREALQHLQKALVRENQSALGYRQLSQAYGRLNRIADAELAAAQSYFYSNDLKAAKAHAERARRQFPEGSPSWIKADDIVNFKPPSQN